MPKYGKRDLVLKGLEGGGGGGGGGHLKNCYLFCGGKVLIHHTFLTSPPPPAPGRNKRSVSKVASRYRAFSSICDLFIRIVLSFNFEFKVLTDRNKRSEMFI